MRCERNWVGGSSLIFPRKGRKKAGQKAIFAPFLFFSFFVGETEACLDGRDCRLKSSQQKRRVHVSYSFFFSL